MSTTVSGNSVSYTNDFNTSLSSPTCDIFIDAFQQSVTLGISALLSANVPAYEGISADAVATLPIGMSVLQRIFMFSGNVAANANAPCAPTFLANGNLASIDAVTPYLAGNLSTACTGLHHGYNYLNPSYALLPSTHSPICLPVYINGTLASEYTNVSSANNTGGTSAIQKGAQLVTYPNGIPVQAINMVVKFDFVRYLSNCLFNTPYGMSLFTNEVALFDNLDSICLADVQNIDSVLTPDAAAGWTHDSNGMSFNCAAANNVCHSILQSIYAQYPHRFTQANLQQQQQQTTTGSSVNSHYYYVPFAPGDTLRHILEIFPNPHQGSVVSNMGLSASASASASNLSQRRYEVVWVVIDDLPFVNANDDTVMTQTIEYGVMSPAFINAAVPY